MRKMIIADDEFVIRNGLKKALDWQALGVEVVGEAEDGEEALALAREHVPDLMLVDINMPLMNGIELIEQIGLINSRCKIIIITGYDEFEYAREAIRLNVSDYILKPVAKSKLLAVVNRVLHGMDENMAKENYSHWAQQKVESSKAYLLSEFFSKWLSGSIPGNEVPMQLDLFGFPEGPSGIISVSPLGSKEYAYSESAMEKELALFCINNIVTELSQEKKQSIVLNDSNDNVFCFYALEEKDEMELLAESMKRMIRQYLKCNVFITINCVSSISEDMIETYRSISKKIKDERMLTPVIASAKNLIDTLYSDRNLSLEILADKLDISPQYLSKLFKKEFGKSYKEYLTQVRIDKAILYMKDPMKRMYEVADSVGYKSQHYFSAAFKKVKGMSPNDFKNKYL